MKFVSISDLHIKNAEDAGANVLQAFFANERTSTADTLYFLGDIFDLMAGYHRQYYKKYEFFFEEILKALKKGQKIVFFEGNHDMHLKKLFFRYFAPYTENIEIVKGNLIKNINGKKILFCHGDDLQRDRSYQAYKVIITSKPMNIVANYLMPFNVLEKVGHKASQKSRKRSSNDIDYEAIRRDFRKGAVKKLLEEECDFLVAGHSHVLDDYSSEYGRYLNNGYPSKDRKFIYFNGEDFSFESVDSL